jgi:Plasma-membrane choline transporter
MDTESLIEYFNKWAYVYVGLYGVSFMEAGSNVMQLFRARGWTAIIADLMVDTVLCMLSVGVGLLTAVVAVIICMSSVMGVVDTTTLAMSFGIGFGVGYATCATLFSIVSSAVNTVIVLYAEGELTFLYYC